MRLFDPTELRLSNRIADVAYFVNNQGPFHITSYQALVCARRCYPRITNGNRWNARRETFLPLKHEPFSNSACRAFISFGIVAEERETNFNEVGFTLLGGGHSGQGFLMLVVRSFDSDCKKPETILSSDGEIGEIVYRPRIQPVPIDRFIASPSIHYTGHV